MNIEPTRTSYRSPWQNGVAERFVGTLRRELLDHMIVIDDRHLHRLLGEYIGYYLKDRTPSWARQRCAMGSSRRAVPSEAGGCARRTAGRWAAPQVLVALGCVSDPPRPTS